MQTKQILGLEIINMKAKAIYDTPSHMRRDWGMFGKGFSEDKKEVKKNFYF